MRKVTIRMIAKAADVSIGTVDRALNDRGRIKDETRKKVLDIAGKLGYRPNKIASALGRQHKFSIAAVTPYNPFYFNQHIFRGLEEAAGEIADFGVSIDIIPYDRLTVEEGKKALAALDKSRYDGIVLNAGGDGLAPLIDSFVDSGIPVVTFNSDASLSKRSFFVGENACRSGRMAGYMMGRLLNGRGTIAIMTSFMYPGAHMNRRMGFLDALKEFPDISAVANCEYYDNDAMAYDVICGIMAKFPDISGVFSNSATGSNACARYALEHRGEKLPVLIGYDVTENVEKCLLEGLFDMAIDQQPDRQSYNAVMLMYRHLAEHWRPAGRELEIRTNMVMRHNAREHSLARSRSEDIIL